MCVSDFRVHIDLDIETMRKQNTHTNSKLCAIEINPTHWSSCVVFLVVDSRVDTFEFLFLWLAGDIFFLVSPLHAMTSAWAHTAYTQFESNTENALDTQKQIRTKKYRQMSKLDECRRCVRMYGPHSIFTGHKSILLSGRNTPNVPKTTKTATTTKRKTAETRIESKS